MFNYNGLIILEKAKLFMYKAIFDYFEKELDYSYLYTDIDGIFIKNVFPKLILLMKRWIKEKLYYITQR